MSSPTHQIKERLSIVDVVGSYIKLERAGANYRARCPFHSERTPSFFVSPERNSYYCFGCGAKGDIFSFVQQFEGLDFKGALYALADKAGVEIKPEDPKKKDEREKLYSILEAASIFFQNQLQEREEAINYLSKRGIKTQTIQKWRLGYALDEWRKLLEHLTSQGFSQEEALNAGLVKQSNDRTYDVFRGRVMFPIADSAGRIVAFSGRDIKEKENSRVPKYINTPETLLFNKSRVLYGFDKAKHSIRSYNFAIVVEGQTDLLMVHQTEFTNTVALSGTALTNYQLDMIKRLSPNLLLALDADEAGISSAGKSAMRALSIGMDVKVADLPEGKDPADLVLSDKENWRNAIRNAFHIVDFHLALLERKGLDDRKFRLAVSKNILPYISIMPNKIDQSHFISRIASRLNLGEDIIREEVAKISPDEHLEGLDLEKSGEESPAGEEVHTRSREELIERQLSGIVLWQESLREPWIDTAWVRGELERIGQIEIEGGDSEELIFEAERFYSESQSLEKEVASLIFSLEKEKTEKEFGEVLRELKQAEQEGTEERAQELREKCQKISERINNLSG